MRSQTITITIDKKVYKRLALMKINEELNNFTETIDKLLKETKR
jgi:predicted CopG family antitoxin